MRVGYQKEECWFTIEVKWWPFLPMATSCYVRSLLPHCQRVRLLLQFLPALILQKCSERGLRFPDRKCTLAKAQTEIMLGQLENKIIFKNFGRPSDISISSSFHGFSLLCDQGSFGDHTMHWFFSHFVERHLRFPNKESNQEGFRVKWRERERERERHTFSSRTFTQGQSARLPARLADRASSRQSDKKVIRTTCHFPLRPTWEAKWKQCLHDKLSCFSF